MKTPSKEEWLKVYYFVMFLSIWIAYALSEWATAGHLPVYVAVLGAFGLAAAGARMLSTRAKSEAEDPNSASPKQRELRALAEEQIKRASSGQGYPPDASRPL